MPCLLLVILKAGAAPFSVAPSKVHKPLNHVHVLPFLACHRQRREAISGGRPVGRFGLFLIHQPIKKSSKGFPLVSIAVVQINHFPGLRYFPGMRGIQGGGLFQGFIFLFHVPFSFPGPGAVAPGGLFLRDTSDGLAD